jgi:hypothetical protein
MRKIILSSLIVIGAGILILGLYHSSSNEIQNDSSTKSSISANLTPNSTKPDSPNIQAVGSKGTPNKAAARQPALQGGSPAGFQFEKDSIQGWSFSRDPFTNRVMTINGGKIALVGQSEIDQSQEFIQKYGVEIFGLSARDLKNQQVQKTDRVKVVYQQYYGDVRIVGATLGLIYENGALTRIQSDLVPIDNIKAEKPMVSKADASSWINQHGMDKFAKQSISALTVSSAEPVLVPTTDRLVPAFEMIVEQRSANNILTAKKKVLVDAVDVHVIRSTNILID